MDSIHTDMLGRKLVLNKPVKKIVSLVPSVTEFLFDIGLEKEVVGVTKFCKYPDTVSDKMKVGGTKNVDIDKIDSLSPDLIIAHKEENEKSTIDELQKKYPVWVGEVKTIDDAFTMMNCLGLMTGKHEEVANLVKEIKGSISGFKSSTNLRACYLIWKKPFMTVGGDTFINAMMEKAGFENVFKDRNRYPITDLDEISALAPDIILLSSEPYFFKEKDKAEIEQLCSGQTVKLVNGEIFSWYGSRMRLASDYFKSLF
ncbi:MAG: ABC transporter substrate-binding protein [Sporocytophaga sp.]|uniref:helical backbone metal receptor n=1 Tax=Sporocytophaga sp. TaxID=2231183 RepID=UPI001B064E45|nr:helical backbone metal receptor [Sporocytophaga sp.]MBO9703096.1 ABC transporter substrate-binding protein [Sporocytophaga sp.]